MTTSDIESRQAFVNRGSDASGRWMRHALTFPCGCKPEAPGCDDGRALFAAHLAEEPHRGVGDALAALGEARAELEAAIRREPARAFKGSIENLAGLGGVMYHVEMAIAELVESLKPEELAYVRNQSEGTPREPVDGAAAPEATGDGDGSPVEGVAVEPGAPGAEPVEGP